MTSLRIRILMALRLQPMTVPQLARCLMRSTKHVRAVVHGLRERGRIEEVGRDWNARIYALEDLRR